MFTTFLQKVMQLNLGPVYEITEMENCTAGATGNNSA